MAFLLVLTVDRVVTLAEQLAISCAPAPTCTAPGFQLLLERGENRGPKKATPHSI